MARQFTRTGFAHPAIVSAEANRTTEHVDVTTMGDMTARYIQGAKTTYMKVVLSREMLERMRTPGEPIEALVERVTRSQIPVDYRIVSVDVDPVTDHIIVKAEQASHAGTVGTSTGVAPSAGYPSAGYKIVNSTVVNQPHVPQGPFHQGQAITADDLNALWERAHRGDDQIPVLHERIDELEVALDQAVQHIEQLAARIEQFMDDYV